MKEAEIRERLRAFILDELLQRSDYPLKDGEPLITGGLIDSFSLAQIAVFAEGEFEVYLPNSELTVEQMDTVDQMVCRIVEHRDR